MQAWLVGGERRQQATPSGALPPRGSGAPWLVWAWLGNKEKENNSTVEYGEDRGTSGEAEGSDRVRLGGCVVALGARRGRKTASLERISDCMQKLTKVRPGYVHLSRRLDALNIQEKARLGRNRGDNLGHVDNEPALRLLPAYGTERKEDVTC